jgi:hypothetical protein
VSLLATGTVAQVNEYYRKLVEIMGRDGGYIMSSAAVIDDAKFENVKALVDCTREMG